MTLRGRAMQSKTVPETCHRQEQGRALRDGRLSARRAPSLCLLMLIPAREEEQPGLGRETCVGAVVAWVGVWTPVPIG